MVLVSKRADLNCSVRGSSPFCRHLPELYQTNILRHLAMLYINYKYNTTGRPSFYQFLGRVIFRADT